METQGRESVGVLSEVVVVVVVVVYERLLRLPNWVVCMLPVGGGVAPRSVLPEVDEGFGVGVVPKGCAAHVEYNCIGADDLYFAVAGVDAVDADDNGGSTLVVVVVADGIF